MVLVEIVTNLENKQPYFTKLEYKSSQHDVRPYSIMIENIAPNDSNLLNSI